MGAVLDQLSLYDICYAGLFAFAWGIHFRRPPWLGVGLVYLAVLMVSVNPLITTRWQGVIFYIVLITLASLLQTAADFRREGREKERLEMLEAALTVSCLTYINLNLEDYFYNFLLGQLDISQNRFYFIFYSASLLFLTLLSAGEYRLLGWMDRRFQRGRRLAIAAMGMLALVWVFPHIYSAIRDLTISRGDVLTYLVSINLTIIALFILGVCVLFYAYSQMKEVQRQRANEQLNREYSNMVSRQYQEMRRFRHDYRNIMLGLDGFIRAGQWDELREYFDREVLPSQEVASSPQASWGALANLKNVDIQSLLYSKCSYADSLGIPVQAAVDEDLPELTAHRTALVRMLGILMDNAIEASQETPDPRIEISLVRSADTADIMIANRSQAKPEILAQINREGYSTKGRGRGLGLANLQELADDNGIQVYTMIQDGLFIQELFVPINQEGSEGNA